MKIEKTKTPQWLIEIDNKIKSGKYTKAAELLYKFFMGNLNNLTPTEEKCVCDYLNKLSTESLHKLFYGSDVINFLLQEHSLIDKLFSLSYFRNHNPLVSLLKDVLAKSGVLNNQDHVKFLCYLARQGELALLEALAREKKIYFDMNDRMINSFIVILIQDLKDKIKNLTEKDPLRADTIKVWNLLREQATFQPQLRSYFIPPLSSERTHSSEYDDLCSRTRQLFAAYKSFNLNSFLFALREDIQKKKTEYEAAKAIPIVGWIKANATRYETKRNFILQKLLPAIRQCIDASSDENKEKLARILSEGAREFTTFNSPSNLALIFEQGYFELSDPAQMKDANFILKPVVGIVIEKEPTMKMTEATNRYRVFTPYQPTIFKVDVDLEAALAQLQVPTGGIQVGQIIKNDAKNEEMRCFA